MSIPSTVILVVRIGGFLVHPSWEDLVGLLVCSWRQASPVSYGDPASCLFIAILSTVSTDGGTESLGITAGETKNPSKNMPRVVKFVFWRRVRGACQLAMDWQSAQDSHLLYCHCTPNRPKRWEWKLVTLMHTISLILLLVPYTYPNLSNQSTVTSPFTIVFQKVGSGEIHSS